MTENNDAIEKVDASKMEVRDGSLLLHTANDAIIFARWNFESGLLPEHIKNSKQAFAIMMRGAELGLKPHASWRWLYMTKGGKIAMETKGKLAVCQADPSFVDYREWIEHEDGPEEGWKAVAVAKRKNREDTIKEFSFKDAERAKLTGKKKNFKGQEYDSTYTLYLKDMLLARARDRALDLAFADVLGGIPSKEIMDDVEAREPRESRGTTPDNATVRDPMLDLLAPKAPAEVVEAEIVDRVDPEARKVIDAQVEEVFGSEELGAEIIPDELEPQSWECGACGLVQHVNNTGCSRCGAKRGEEPPPLADEQEGVEAEATHQREKMAVVKPPRGPEEENPFERGRQKAKEMKKKGQQELPKG
jgi:hypothetical protein